MGANEHIQKRGAAVCQNANEHDPWRLYRRLVPTMLNFGLGYDVGDL